MFENLPEITPNKYKRFIFDSKKNKNFSTIVSKEQFNKIFAAEVIRKSVIKLDIPARKYRNKIFFDSLSRMKNYLQQEIDTRIEQETKRIKREYHNRMYNLEVAVGKYESLMFLQKNCPKITEVIWKAT